MKSGLANHSSFLDLSLNKTPFKTATLKNAGNDDFKQWMSSFNPLLLSKYPSFSKESQSKLRSLHYLSLQANSTVDEVTKSINRCGSEYEALAQKTLSQIQFIGIDEEELSSETHILLQECGDVVVNGHVGDGTDAAAVANLAGDFLTQANISRQKLQLEKDIQIIQMKNEKLKESLQYFERESKMAAREVSSQQAMLKNLSTDLNITQSKLCKLNGSILSANTELDELGVSPAISNQAILEIHQTYKTLQTEILLLKRKLSKYDELPPSVAEASKMVSCMKQQLESMSDQLKLKLSTFH